MNTSDKTITRTFSVVDDKTGSNRLIAEVIAEGAWLAHRRNPNSWVITHYEGAPTLIVGNIDVAVSAWFSGGYGLTVSHEATTPPQLKIIEAHRNKSGSGFASQPWSTYLRLPNDEQLAERLAVLAPCYHQALDRLAAMKGTTHARLHREDMRHAVEVLSGQWLPTPAYVTSGHHAAGIDYPTGSNSDPETNPKGNDR